MAAGTTTSTTTVPAYNNRAAQRRKSILSNLGYWLAFLPLGFVVIIPVAYIVSMAFTTQQNQLLYPVQWIPNPVTLENFIQIFNEPTLPIVRWFGNSVLVATVGTVLVLVVSSLSGYAFARLQFPGRSAIFSTLIASLMIPGAVTLIPVFIMLRDLKLLDTYMAIWMPAIAGITGIFLLRQHFFSIPSELEDAARVDGANRFRIFYQIALPLVRGALVALAIFTFLGLWNDLFWPLIVLSGRSTLTLPVGLLVIQQGSYVNAGLSFAASFIATMPTLLIYAIFQRKIIAGVSTSGLAGQ
jgi:multiple sugar transport system permease protein